MLLLYRIMMQIYAYCFNHARKSLILSQKKSQFTNKDALNQAMENKKTNLAKNILSITTSKIVNKGK